MVCLGPTASLHASSWERSMLTVQWGCNVLTHQYAHAKLTHRYAHAQHAYTSAFSLISSVLAHRYALASVCSRIGRQHADESKQSLSSSSRSSCVAVLMLGVVLRPLDALPHVVSLYPDFCSYLSVFRIGTQYAHAYARNMLTHRHAICSRIGMLMHQPA